MKGDWSRSTVSSMVPMFYWAAAESPTFCGTITIAQAESGPADRRSLRSSRTGKLRISPTRQFVRNIRATMMERSCWLKAARVAVNP